MKVENMERSSLVAYPAKVEPEASLSELIKQVLQLVQKDITLSKKQARLPLMVDLDSLYLSVTNYPTFDFLLVKAWFASVKNCGRSRSNFILARFFLQAAFCDDACVIRFLKARENNARRAARMLRATLNWREKITIGRSLVRTAARLVPLPYIVF